MPATRQFWRFDAKAQSDLELELISATIVHNVRLRLLAQASEQVEDNDQTRVHPGFQPANSHFAGTDPTPKDNCSDDL
jgi:hypothetical protein